MLRFDDVSFGYGPAAALKNISFHLQAGDFAALVGPNGAGKSTLSKLANGLFKPESGIVLSCGMDTQQCRTSHIARKAGMLFQNPDRQICQKTIGEEIRFSLDCILDDAEEKERRCRDMLDFFGFSAQRDPFTMSRGDRQRIAFASVLVRRPELLIIDEPTTGLDSRSARRLLQYLARLNSEGMTILMITHDMEVVQEYANRVLVLKNGQLIADDTVPAVMNNSLLLQQASLLPAPILALAMALGDDFAGIDTVEKMTEIIERKCV